MLTKEQALRKVTEELRRKSPTDDEFIVVDEGTIERPFGWVCFYNSKKYLETGNISHALAGNGPVIVNKLSGEVHFFGTYKPPMDFIADYERELRSAQTPR